MFGIGLSEYLVILVLALIVLGPQKLPQIVREVGHWVGRARALARQFQKQLQEEVDASASVSLRSDRGAASSEGHSQGTPAQGEPRVAAPRRQSAAKSIGIPGGE